MGKTPRMADDSCGVLLGALFGLVVLLIYEKKTKCIFPDGENAPYGR